MAKAYADILKEMMDYCRTNNVYWFSDFCDYACKNHKSWVRVLMNENGSRTMAAYLASRARKDGIIGDKEFKEWMEDVTMDD